MINKVNSKPRSLFMTTALAGTTLTYVIFWFLPGQHAIAQMRLELHQIQTEIVQAERLSFAIQKAQQDLEQSAAFTDQWQESAPGEDALASLLASVTDLALQSGVVIKKLEPDSIVHHNSIAYVSIEVQCKGDFRETFDFVAQLENLPATVWLPSVHIELARSARRSGEPSDASNDQSKLQSGEELTTEITLMIFADKQENSG